ncbi:MAG: type 4a pilus biogenesis protein PilO [Desulfobacterales bacterium]
MNKIDTSKISNWIFQTSDKIGKLSKLYRIFLCLGVFVLLVGPFLYFSFLPKLSQIDTLEKESSALEKKLTTAQKKASQFKLYQEKLENAKLEFKIVTKKLPEKKEIPSLLANISQSARDSGLDILLFQPLAERDKDFYAEIPVSITVNGSYQNVALFFDKVARLNRIVNIDNIKMSAAKGNDNLTTSCTAITYRFIESTPKKQTKRKKAS